MLLLKLLSFGVVSCVSAANGAPWSSLKSMELGIFFLREVCTEESDYFLTVVQFPTVLQ